MSSFKPLITDQTLASLSMVGGLLIFCVGVNLVWGQKVRVANMLPAILVAPHPDVPAHRLVRATAALFVELIIRLCSRGPLPFTALGVVQCRCLGEPSTR